MRIGDWSSDGCSSDRFRLQRTPLDVSGPLRAHREASRAAWIFTSATLAVDGHFNHIATRLGLEDPHELLAPSPFDWRSEEHTSELQSLMRISYAVFCLKKKTHKRNTNQHTQN